MSDSLDRWLAAIEKLKRGKVSRSELEEQFNRRFVREARAFERKLEKKKKPKNRHVTKKADRPRCGAKTRAGGRCKAPPVWDVATNKPRNGRCRMHGGLTPKWTEIGRTTLRWRRYGDF